MSVNRIVAFLGPLIAVFAGAVVTWLFTHVHFLSIFEHDQAQGWVEQGLVFLVTSVLVWLGESKWLDGWQRWEARVVDRATAATLAKSKEASRYP